MKRTIQNQPDSTHLMAESLFNYILASKNYCNFFQSQLGFFASPVSDCVPNDDDEFVCA